MRDVIDPESDTCERGGLPDPGVGPARPARRDHERNGHDGAHPDHPSDGSEAEDRYIENAFERGPDRSQDQDRERPASGQAVRHPDPKGPTGCARTAGRGGAAPDQRRDAERDKHAAHTQLERVAEGFGKRNAEEHDRDSYAEEREAVPDSPAGAEKRRMREALFPAHDGGHRHEVVRVQRVPETERKAQEERRGDRGHVWHARQDRRAAAFAPAGSRPYTRPPVTSPTVDKIARRLDLRAQTGTFDWRTPEGAELSGAGAVARFEASGPDRYEAAKEWLHALSVSGTLRHEGDAPAPLIAVGGFSFAPNSAGSAASFGDAVFWVPERIARRAPGGETENGRWRRADGTRRPEAPRPPVRSAFHAMGRTAWTEIVREALDRIAAGTLQKVVLARGVEIESPGPVDPRTLLHVIAEANPRAYRYLLRPAQGAAFLGASPERLVSLVDGAVASDAVAGTVRLDDRDRPGAAGAANGAAVASLLTSEKDRCEHAPVVRHIVEALSPLCTVVTASDAAAQVHRRLAHIHTTIRGMATPGTHVLDLVERLHPTPAVAGTPGDLALAFLREREPVDRGWYAGVVGWMDAHGNGDFVVGIRSAFLEESRTLLFAGAGIVAGSNPDAEWEETELKLSMMREAIAHAGR